MLDKLQNKFIPQYSSTKFDKKNKQKQHDTPKLKGQLQADRYAPANKPAFGKKTDMSQGLIPEVIKFTNNIIGGVKKEGDNIIGGVKKEGNNTLIDKLKQYGKKCQCGSQRNVVIL